jgi:hypothetical protein
MGKGLSNKYLVIEMTKRGLAKFTGNQWGECWDWRREELDKLSLEELKNLYERS